MAGSLADYAVRISDTGGYITETLGDLQTFVTKIFFVAKHQTEENAAKIRIEGTIVTPSTGVVEVDLAPAAISTPEFRPGIYDVQWEAEDPTVNTWSPASGCKTLEITGSLK